MYNFQYANPTRVCFGEGQIAKLPELIPAGSRLLVLYGGGSIKQNGVYEQLTQALAGREWLEFPGIGANPQYDQLMEAVALVKRERIDFLLAMGGGSVVDGTKFVAAAACFEGDDPWEILRDKASIKGALPLGCVLTLPATGSGSDYTLTGTKSFVIDGHTANLLVVAEREGRAARTNGCMSCSRSTRRIDGTRVAVPIGHPCREGKAIPAAAAAGRPDRLGGVRVSNNSLAVQRQRPSDARITIR